MKQQAIDSQNNTATAGNTLNKQTHKKQAAILTTSISDGVAPRNNKKLVSFTSVFALSLKTTQVAQSVQHWVLLTP